MKEMVYTDRRHDAEVIAEGMIGPYLYWVTSLGTHPCAYVALPEGHPDYNRCYEYIHLDVHCGLTYSSDSTPFGNNEGSIIGWDYAHYGDYCGYMSDPILGIGNTEDLKRYKVWTTEEIVEECKNVIEQLEMRREQKHELEQS